MTWKQVNKVWYSSTLEIVNARVSLENRRALLNAATSTSLWLHRNPLRQLSRDGNLHGSGMSQATTTSPKPSSRVPWMVTPYFSSEEMLDGQHQRVDIAVQAGTAHNGLLREDWEGIFVESSLMSSRRPKGTCQSADFFYFCGVSLPTVPLFRVPLCQEGHIAVCVFVCHECLCLCTLLCTSVYVCVCILCVCVQMCMCVWERESEREREREPTLSCSTTQNNPRANLIYSTCW